MTTSVLILTQVGEFAHNQYCNSSSYLSCVCVPVCVRVPVCVPAQVSMLLLAS